MSLADRIPIGVSSGQIFPDGKVDMEQVRSLAVRAEELGYDSLWTQEQVFGNVPCIEPLSLLTYLSGITTKVRLGVSVLVLPLHNPVRLAKIVSSVDQLTEGRLELGLGIGGAPAIYPKLNLTADRRVRRFVEGLDVMRALWTEDAPTYDGELYKLAGDPMQPKPAQQGGPPVWFGARHSDALRRAVRHADGWMGAGSSTSEAFKEGVVTVRQHLEDEKRDPATFRISKRVYIAVDNDEARGERRLREWFGQYYGNPDNATKVGVWGTPEHCAEQLEELVDAGAEHLLLNMAFDLPEQIEALAEMTGLKH